MLIIFRAVLLLLLSHFSRVRLCDPIDGSPPGSPVPGILQARTLEWVAISFNAWKWKVKVKSLSCVRFLATPWTAAYQAPPPVGFSRQEYWTGVPLPSPYIYIYIYIYILKRIYKSTCKYCLYAFLYVSCKYYGRIEAQREESWPDTDGEKRGREKIAQYRDTEGG